MHIIISPYSGFCPGVKEAEKKIFQTKSQLNTPLYVYGDLIHNKNYIHYLNDNQIHTIQNYHSLPSGSCLVIRAHGIDRQIENKIKNQFQLIDLTCDTVKKLQLKIKSYSEAGYYIIITGKKEHPEIEGLKSYAKHYSIIHELNDLDKLLKQNQFEQNYKIVVLSQTTGNANLLNSVFKSLKSKLNNNYSVELYFSICPITSMREEHSAKLLDDVDISFVIGDKKSSNAEKLYRSLAQKSDSVFFVEDLNELRKLNLELSKYKTALVSSSSSTPVFIENEIIQYLKNI